MGGRLFPGKHHYARFSVREANDNYQVAFTSSDATRIQIDATETTSFDPGSIFETLDNASGFFEKGAVGYSPNGSKYEGLKLQANTWQVRPLHVHKVHSSFFENEAIFPRGSVRFDNALLMTNHEHEWNSVANKRITG